MWRKKFVCKEIFSLLRGTTTSPFFVKLFKVNLEKKQKSLIFVTASLFHTQCILIEFPQLFSHSSSWHFQRLSLFVIFYGFNYIAWWWWQSFVTLLKFNEKIIRRIKLKYSLQDKYQLLLNLERRNTRPNMIWGIMNWYE